MKTITIEPSRMNDNSWNVYEWDRYPEGSVLACQSRKSFIDSSDDLEQLKRDYPTAELYDFPVDAHNDLPDTAPAWFDPQAIGESWGGDE